VERRSRLNERFYLSKRPPDQTRLPQILARLQANQESLRRLREAFPHFVLTVPARCFADLVQPFSLLRFPRLALSRQLITQHSPRIHLSLFDVSLPPTSPSTFSISSLPAPRSAFDCRRLDAMDRSHRRCVCPAFDAVITAPCGAVWTSFRDRRVPLPPLPAGRRPLGRIEAASGRTRIASVCGMSTLDNWWDDRPAIRGTGEHREDPPGDATRRLNGRNDDRRMNELL
jgi:hypothetical protein